MPIASIDSDLAGSAALAVETDLIRKVEHQGIFA
jgi:hypothetical protein